MPPVLPPAAALAEDVIQNLNRGRSASQAKQSLTALVEARQLGVPSLEVHSRRHLTERLLEWLTSNPREHQSPETAELRLVILKTLRELSRLPGGSDVQSKPTGLKTLLSQVSFPLTPGSEQLAVLRRTSVCSQASSEIDTDTLTNSSSSSLSHVLSRARNSGLARSQSLDCRARMKSNADAAQSISFDSSISPLTAHDRSDTPCSLLQASSSFTDWSSQHQGPKAADWDATDITLRCLNNALFLHEVSRKSFAEDAVGGARKAIRLLRNPWQTPTDILFLAGRLLFYATLFEATFNRVAVEEENVVRHLSDCVTALVSALRAQGGQSGNKAVGGPHQVPSQINAALSELLKVIFNLGLYYPRMAEDAGIATSCQDKKPIAGEQWHEKLAPLFEPVTHLLLNLPPAPLAPPTTHAIAVFLNFPASLCQPPPQRKTDPLICSGQDNEHAAAAKPGAAKRIANMLFAHDPKSPRQNALSAGFLPKHQGSEGFASENSLSVTLASHLADILSRVLERYFPPTARAPTSLDTDDFSVRALAQADGNTDLEDVIQPLCLLLRKLCAENETLRRELKAHFLPDDLDRSVAPDKRGDTTGRLIRLMSSLMLPRLARASGELLLALCKGEASEMVAEIGYGPCAGWLVSNGYGMPVPTGNDRNMAGASTIEEIIEEERDSVATKSAAAVGTGAFTNRGAAPLHAPVRDQQQQKKRSINPITGSYDIDFSADDLSAAPMTDDEKGAEAERLFDLFDRLNRTGIVKVPHPVRDADPAKLRELDDREARERRRGEDVEEEEAMRDLAVYRARKARGTSSGR